MTYEELKRQHAAQMAKVRAALSVNDAVDNLANRIVQLETERDQLRAELAAANARADAAEARAMAATQQWVVARAQLESLPDYIIYCIGAWEVFEADSDGPKPLDFAEWLAQQDGVQPEH